MKTGNVLIVDTETTDLTPQTGCVIEVGAILYNVPNQTTITQLSFLLPSNHGNPQYKINKIPESVVNEDVLCSKTELFSVSLLKQLADNSDYIIAHNADFDKQWFDGSLLPKFDKQWLCTYSDFKFPEKSGCSLIELALAHGVPVTSAHRALTDCQLIAAIFDRMTDLQAMIQYAATPRKTYIADIVFKQNHLAKDNGFRFDSTTKKWIKKLTEDEVDSLPFNVIPA